MTIVGNMNNFHYCFELKNGGGPPVKFGLGPKPRPRICGKSLDVEAAPWRYDLPEKTAKCRVTPRPKGDQHAFPGLKFKSADPTVLPERLHNCGAGLPQALEDDGSLIYDRLLKTRAGAYMYV